MRDDEFYITGNIYANTLKDKTMESKMKLVSMYLIAFGSPHAAV